MHKYNSSILLSCFQVKCAHSLYHRKKVTTMTFADVGEVAFANGPPWGRKFSKWARFSILFGLFLAYFGTCSVYTVIIAKNFKIVSKIESVFNFSIYRFAVAILKSSTTLFFTI